MPPAKNGVDDGARTHDRRNHNPVLYQLSYAHHYISSNLHFECFWLQINSCQREDPYFHTEPFLAEAGTPGRTRTCNPRLRRPMLYPVELRALVKTREPPGRTLRAHLVSLSPSSSPALIAIINYTAYYRAWQKQGCAMLRISFLPVNWPDRVTLRGPDCLPLEIRRSSLGQLLRTMFWMNEGSMSGNPWTA